LTVTDDELFCGAWWFCQPHREHFQLVKTFLISQRS